MVSDTKNAIFFGHTVLVNGNECERLSRHPFEFGCAIKDPPWHFSVGYMDENNFSLKSVYLKKKS